MKKSIMLIAAVLLLAITTSNATHIVGGEISVKWVSGNTFHITLHFYRDCANGQVDFDNPIPIGVYDKVTNTNQQCLSGVALTSRKVLALGDSCYNPNLCVELGTYETDVLIPNNKNGYYISYGRCCRNGAIITNIANAGNAGEEWYAEIPDPALHNSTPVFGAYPKGYMCAKNINIQDFSCTDADNDSLVYSLVTPLNGNTNSINSLDACPDAGPYPVITWVNGYSDTTMLGVNSPIKIDSLTGILKATPNNNGVFVFCVRVEQFRRSDKVKLGEVRRDIQYAVLACNSTTASPDTIVCAGNPVTLHATGGTIYKWAPTTGLNNPNIANPTATVSASTTYTVSVSSGSCVTTATVTVNVNSTVKLAITPGGPTTFCQGGSVTLAASGATAYSWSTGASTTSISVASTGTYSVTGTTSGCTGTASISVTVNPIPVINITPGGPATVCKGATVKLTAGGGTTYAWSTGSTSSTITVNSTGTYTVTGTTNGCSASATQAATINPAPIVAIAADGPTTLCQGDSVTLTASGAQKYLWDIGASTSSIVSKVNQTYYAVGTDGNGCTAVSNFITVVVNRIPTATITAEGPTSFCPGGSVPLCAGGGVSYLWSQGGATTTCITAATQGHYTVTATNGGGCKNSTGIDITVNTPPVVVASPDGPTSFCQGGSVNIGGTGATSYVWNPNGEKTTSINVTQSGTFYAVGTDASGCTGISNSVTVTVNPLPNVSIDADGPTTFCDGNSVNLTASGAATYVWSPGGQTDVSLRISSSGSYSTLGTDANGCTGTSNTIPVLVNPNPTVSIIPQGPTAICEGGSVELCASNGTTFSWNNNGGTSQCFTVMNPATYIVSITDDNGCSATSDPLVVSVKLPPTVVANVSGPLTCATTSVTITANNCVADTAITYSWNGPAGFTSLLQCTSANTVGTYTVTASNGCISSTTVPVGSEVAIPDVTTAGGELNCTQPTLQLTANSKTPGVTYSWTGPNGFTSALQSPIVSDSGTYIVTATNPTNGCTSSASAQVTKLPGQASGTCGDEGSIVSGFELDGDAITQTLDPRPDDWDLVYKGTSHADYSGFSTDASSSADNYFKMGTKDIQDISGWHWSTQSVPDKDDILHTGAAIYGHLFYFFGDRYATNGNSQMGCWLLQNNIQPNADGTFNGQHAIGDLLVLCNFTNGGRANAPVLFAYEWVGSGGSDGPLNAISLEDANAFAIVNSATVPSPWPYTPKFGASNQFAPGAFFEGGIDLACLKGEGVNACFPSFLIETRASQSVTAELKDFVLGNLVVNPNKSHRMSVPASGAGRLLLTAYPNPFSSVSSIVFERTDETAPTLVEVYTLTGEKIATLFNKDAEAGITYKVDFDGSRLAPGVYIYRVTSNDKTINGKLILMK